MDDLKDTDTRVEESRAEQAYRAHLAGDSEPLYEAFLAQARVAVASKLHRGDDTLCHQIASRGLLNVGKFRGDSKISTWFYTIAQNECNRELRRFIKSRQRHVELPSIEPGGKVDKKLSDAADQAFGSQAVSEDETGRLEQLLSALPAEQAEIARLRIEGLSIKEIVAKTGISQGTVASRLRLAKKKLKNKFVQE